MHDFLEWLTEQPVPDDLTKDHPMHHHEQSSNITISLDRFTRSLQQYAEKLLDGVLDSRYKASQFQPVQFLQQLRTKLAHYPQINNLLRALESKNQQYILDQHRRLMNWVYQQSEQEWQQAKASRSYYASRPSETYRELAWQIYTYLDTFRPQKDMKQVEQEMAQEVQQAIAETQREMQNLQVLIEQAISRIPDWNGSPIVIFARNAENEHGIMLASNDAADVSLGTSELAPYFLLFRMDQKIVIDDVIDSGEEDFFSDPRIRADYFTLIRELQNPGSTSTAGKTITLYTARPVSDRNFYLNTKTLPVNIFLTNNFDHAEGLGRDLDTRHGRDIWKVRIDSRYLMLTNDALGVKYYQVVVPDAPVKSLDLILAQGQ